MPVLDHAAVDRRDVHAVALLEPTGVPVDVFDAGLLCARETSSGIRAVSPLRSVSAIRIAVALVHVWESLYGESQPPDASE